MKALKNYFLTSGIFALYQGIVLFCLVFSCVRAYPFVYGPFPTSNKNYLELMDQWDGSHQVLFTFLLVFEIIFGAVSVIIVAQSPFELPTVKSVRVSVDGERYELSKIGNYYSISKGTDNSGLATLILRTLIGLICIPLNILSVIVKFLVCIFSKKHKEAYKNENPREYWSDMLHLDVCSPWRVLYSQGFVVAEIIVAIVIISLSFTISYMK